jgi:hypothetical protein
MKCHSRLPPPPNNYPTTTQLDPLLYCTHAATGQLFSESSKHDHGTADSIRHVLHACTPPARCTSILPSVQQRCCKPPQSVDLNAVKGKQGLRPSQSPVNGLPHMQSHHTCPNSWLLPVPLQMDALTTHCLTQPRPCASCD